MKTTYTANIDLFIVDGEIEIYDSKSKFKTFSTTPTKPYIKQLDRSKFVKPVNVGDLALEESKSLISPNAKTIFYSGFIKGYNANKVEFTREEVFKAMDYARNYAIYSNDEILNIMKSLSLPKSVTIENDETIDVVW